MPLVTPGKGNSIDIEFKAKVDDLIAKSNAVIAKQEEIKATTKATHAALLQSAKEADKAAQANTMSWTDFRSMYSTVLDVVRVGQAVWDEVGQKYVDNAVLVGNLARAMGTTTEEASQLKEMASSVGISTESLRTSMKLALKDGFEPTVDGLARMSDEYLSLAPGTERMQYLMDRFGKSGEEMGKLLEKGSDGIRKMAAGMDESLIVTEKAYLQARQYQISVDSLSDSWDAFTYKVAPPLIDGLTSVIDSMRDGVRATEMMKEAGINLAFVSEQEKKAWLEKAAAEREATDAALLAAEGANAASGAFETEAERAQRLADEAKAAEQAIRDMTKANEDYLDNIGKLSDNLTDYEKKHDAIQQELNDGKITLEEAGAKWQELADQQEIATNRMMLKMLEEQLAEDGLDKSETEFLLQQGKEWGIYSDKAIESMRAAQAKVDELRSRYQSIPAHVTTTVDNIINTYRYEYGTPQYNNVMYAGRAEGGPIMPNTPYIVGERGPELVSFGQSGNVTPNSDLSNLIDYKKLARTFVTALSQAGG